MLPFYLLLVFLGLHVSIAEDCKGCVPLDSYSFDKVISKFKAALVKFDVAFPYGEKHEQFGKIAAATKDSPDLLVAEVGIKDYGNKDNSDLAKRYDIKKENFPAVRLFLQGKTEPLKFIAEKDEDFNANNIKRFVRAKTDIYLGLPGCIEQLDKLAEEFKTANEKDRKEILNRAKIYEQTLPEEQRAATKVYVKTMERILERGDIFIQTEETRISGLLKENLPTEKKRAMENRRNILQSFTHRDEL
ncbi:endoplasmic reticulum resident protein 29 [Orussus abietinus]|uniref:endoplasmic reticulum resident protein 29 n=1 Tax=Orussus abietinus TaxID=222816 RepID=UPI0006257F51|nr:endoplasmic reticulum resident protein 29 [Orussus abietinus]XP_012273210.1 endoplasmic reticulum resident protein 29 [Orussus abietinus]XP_012273287.1 endoplasmic reticulum resident protein 29 [Orussus abietinus]XP_012273375.1 endoplasmic reticulum resident protein 29 [Orussus abietinus]